MADDEFWNEVKKEISIPQEDKKITESKNAEIKPEPQKHSDDKFWGDVKKEIGLGSKLPATAGTMSLGGTLQEPSLVSSGALGSGKFLQPNVPQGGKWSEYGNVVDPAKRKELADVELSKYRDPKILEEIQREVPWYNISDNPEQVDALFNDEWNKPTSEKLSEFTSAVASGLPHFVAGTIPELAQGLGSLAAAPFKGMDSTIRASRVLGDAAMRTAEEIYTPAHEMMDGGHYALDKTRHLMASPEDKQKELDSAKENFRKRLNAKHAEHLFAEKNPAVLARWIERMSDLKIDWRALANPYGSPYAPSLSDKDKSDLESPAVKQVSADILQQFLPDPETVSKESGATVEEATAALRNQAKMMAEGGIQGAIEGANRLAEDPRQLGAVQMLTPLNIYGVGGAVLGELTGAAKLGLDAARRFGKSAEEYNAAASAAAKGASKAAQQVEVDAMKQGWTEQKLRALDRVIEAGGQKVSGVLEGISTPTKVGALTLGGGIAGALASDDPVAGAYQGAKLGLGAYLGGKAANAMKLGSALASTPKIGAELMEAGRLATGNMGRFATAEAMTTASKATQNAVRALSLGAGGRALDWVSKNALVALKHNVDMAPLMLALGVYNQDDARQFGSSLVEGAGFSFIHGQLLGGLRGSDHVANQLQRRSDAQHANRVLLASSPEHRANVEDLNWDRVVDASSSQLGAAISDYYKLVRTTPDSPEATDALNKVRFLEDAHVKNLKASPETRQAFHEGIKQSLGKADMLINGALSPNRNVNIELLTGGQIIDKVIAANPNYNGKGQPMTPEQAAGMARQRGIFFEAKEAGKGEVAIDPFKDTAVINMDSVLNKSRITGDALPNIIAHEATGHGLFRRTEYREKIAPVYQRLFGTEYTDANGAIQQIVPGMYSRQDLLEMFFKNYVRGETPESQAENLQTICRDAKLWDETTNAPDPAKIVSYMREEVLADAHMGTLYNDPNSPLQSALSWVESRVSGNVLKSALRKLYSMAGPGTYEGYLASTNTGAYFPPEVMQQVKAVESAMEKYEGQFNNAEKSDAMRPPMISKADVLKSREMMHQYHRDTGKFETKPVAIVTDAAGNVISKTDIAATDVFDGVWDYRQDDATGAVKPVRVSGFGDIPEGMKGVSVPINSKVTVQREIVYDEATGKPIERSNGKTKELNDQRNKILRQAIDNAGDPNDLNRFREVPGEGEDRPYKGRLSPEQRAAIAALPESIVPSSMKEKIFKIIDGINGDDGSVWDMDYAARLNNNGGYQAFSPEMRRMVPVSLNLSKDGNFYVGAWSISGLNRKIDLWRQHLPSYFSPWGGDVNAFRNQFRNEFLENLKPKWTDQYGNVGPRPGRTGLDADPTIAKQKADIFHALLGVSPESINPEVRELPKEKFSRKQKKRAKQSDPDTIFRSYRLDSMASLDESPAPYKYPIPYGLTKIAFMPEGGVQVDRERNAIGVNPALLRGLSALRKPEATPVDTGVRFMPDSEADPTMVADGFYSKAGRVLLDKMPNRASADQIRGILDPQKGSGVKPDEMKWSGINQFIDSMQAEKGFVTKDDVKRFLKDSYAAKFETETMARSNKYVVSDPSGHTESYNTEKEAQEAKENWIYYAVENSLNEGVFTAKQNSEGEWVVLDQHYNESRLFDSYESKEKAEDAIKELLEEEWESDVVIDYEKNDDTQYSQYKLPGGTNYEETVLRMPGVDYTSSHFDDVSNYVAHMRTQDFGSGRLIEELQSDLHSDARNKGYEKLPDTTGWTAGISTHPSERDLSLKSQKYNVYSNQGDYVTSLNASSEKEAIQKAASLRKVGIADAPFRKDWPLQLFKHALQKAVADGKEWVGWTGGEAQADRYSLSKHVSAIDLINDGDGKYHVTAYQNTDESALPRSVINKPGLSAQEVADTIGKPLAEKLIADLNSQSDPVTAYAKAEGLDLNVGGEGMKGFYDTILPNEIGKYVKQWGSKVEQGTVPNPEKAIRGLSIGSDGTNFFLNKGQFGERLAGVGPFKDYFEAEDARVALSKGQEQIWKVAITPEMSESVAGGQARFMPEREISEEDNFAPVPTQEELDARKIRLPKYQTEITEEGNSTYIDIYPEGNLSKTASTAELTRYEDDPDLLKVQILGNSYGFEKQGYGEALYREIAKYAQSIGATKLYGEPTSRGAALRREKLFKTETGRPDPEGGYMWASSDIPANVRFMPERINAEHAAAHEAKDEERAREMVRKAAEAAGGRQVKPTAIVSPQYISPRNEITNESQFELNKSNFEKNGWTGRPLLVAEDFNGDQAITGSHRLLAAQKAGVEKISIVKIDLEQYQKWLDENPSAIVLDVDGFLNNTREEDQLAALREAKKEGFKADWLQPAIDLLHIEDESNWQSDYKSSLSSSPFIVGKEIKSADPFTYDNAGKLIPLSERFNPASSDIRFMPERGEREEWTRSIDTAKETADKKLERLRGDRLNLSDAKFEHNLSDDPEMGDSWSFVPPKDKYFDNPSMYDVYESDGKYYVGEGYGGGFKTLQDAQEDAMQRAMGESWKGSQSTFGSDADAQKAVGDIFNAFPKQIGDVTSDGWFSTKWGSWYLEGRIPTGEDDYETFKLSIRDHDSGTRFQKPDKSFFVSKDWTPDETAKALKKAADWIANEATFNEPEAPTEGALSGVRFMPLGEEAQASLSPEEKQRYANFEKATAVPAQISKPDSKYDDLRVGTALLGTKAKPLETPQTSNIAGAIVPDVLLASQLGKMNYPHLPQDVLNEKNPIVKRDKMVAFMKDNLKALYDAFPAELRARATQWYDGARKLADGLSEKHSDITPEQSAGILAVFSPQKDWFMNVAQAYQCADVYKNEQDTVISRELAGKEIEGIINAAEAPQKQKLKAPKGRKETPRQKTIRRNKNVALDQKAKNDRRKILEQLYDRRLADLSDGTKAGDILEAWGIRVLAQIKHGRTYKNIAPEGNFLDNAKKANGRDSTNTWGSTGEIRKAVSIMKNGSLKNISDKLGDEHKVRNFYNNIIAPNTPFGDATIDTHAVAAAHLMPYGSSAEAVKHNFGGSGKSKPLGISGSYHVYMDAYRQLAQELGILPRQLQSITWEAIRELYPSEERSPKLVKEATEIWNKNNENDARQYILRNGISAPVWARATNN